MILYLILILGAFSIGNGQRCPNQWVSHGSECFRFVYNSKLPWRDARNFCKLHGGDLLKISSVAQRNWVFNRAHAVSSSRKLVNRWWIGLNNLEYLVAWEWADGYSVNQTLINWIPGQPNNWQSVQRCGSLWDDNRINDATCDVEQIFICSRNRGDPILCDADRGWQTLNGQCYKVYNYPTTWDGAYRRCDRDGSSMVHIDSYALETTIHDMAVSINKPLWLGLHSIKVDSSTAYWLWVHTNTTGAYSLPYWQSGRMPPAIDKAHLNSTCAVMSNLGTPDNAWYPQSCSSVRAFVCQKPEGSCFPGWIGHRRNCYQFNPHFRLGFNQASQFCQSQGALLLQIAAGSDQELVNSYLQEMSDTGSDSFWIGLSDNNVDGGKFKWRNNQTMSYHNWASGTNGTNTNGRQDCVYINTNDARGRWQVTTSCQSVRSFICYIPMGIAVTSPPSTPIPQYGCPKGWKLHAGYCFFINTTKTDAFTARTVCQNTYGADLAKVDTADKQAFLNGLLDQGQEYYIGLNDRHGNNIFLWNDENYPTNYTNWEPGRPNDYHDEESCVEIRKQQWNDVNCHYNLKFVCSMIATSPFIQPPPTVHGDWTVKCGIGWESNPLSNSCYQFSDEPLEWLDAQLQCQVYGGDLAAITSSAEQNYIAGRLLAMNSLSVWIGANDRETETGWIWVSGDPFSFLNWLPGEPGGKNGPGSDCVSMLTTNGQWDDMNCAIRNGYVCEKTGSITTTPTSPPRTVKPPAGMTLGCQPGWLPYLGNCYLVVSTINTWTYDAAQKLCARRQSHLASIHDKNEHDFIASNIPHSNNSWWGYWIGLNDIAEDNNFVWTDGSPVTYTNWDNTEPNDWKNSNEDCVLIYMHNGKWNDETCTQPHKGLVCKKPKQFVSQTQSPWKQGCPYYTLGYGSHCYWLVGNQPKKWSDALARCNSSFGGTLATINDRFLQAFLSSQMVYRTGHYWLGLSNKAGPGLYTWADGSKIQYTNWNSNHTGNEKASCVAMRADVPIGFWDNRDCGQKGNFVCQFGRQGYTTTPTPGTPWAAFSCPLGWGTYKGFCYKTFCNATKTWMDAVQHCQSMGGDLPSIHSKDQETFLINFTQPCASQYYWFGMNDREAEGGLKYTDGSPIDYTNWHPGEPNNWNGIEDCGIFTTGNYQWNDFNCYNPQSYVCALPRGNQLITTPVPPTGVTDSFLCGYDASWLFFNGSCYMASPADGPNATLSWYDADSLCANYYATLVSVHFGREMEFLQGSFGIRTAWIGLNILNGDKYQWSDGSPVNYVNWNSNEPNNYGGVENCVEFINTGKWNDNLCQNKRKYICKKPVNGQATRVVPSPNPPGGCSNGFVPVDGGRRKCFYVGGASGNVSTLKNFTEARAFCRGFGPGYDLASIEDMYEQEFAITLMSGFTQPLWIGLSDNRGNNQFYWVNGSPLIFTNWDNNNPRSANKNNINRNIWNCVNMHAPWKGHEGKWWDVPCGMKNAYLCQTKQDPSIPVIPAISTCSNPVYKSYNNNCYKRSSSAKTWADAAADCQADGGNLASINDAFESAFIVTIAARNAPYWIGLSDAKVAGLYGWSDGWPVTFTNWGPGQPKFTQGAGHGCVFYDKNGLWNDSDCSNIFNYVCKISTATPPPTIPPTSGNCTNPRQIPFGDYCYYVNGTQQLSYPDASYACNKMGMRLASVHSNAEMTFIEGLSRQFQLTIPTWNPTFWIGLTKGFNGAYRWSDGTAVNYLNWAIGQPSTLGNHGEMEECTEMRQNNGRWNDLSCFNKLGYICKSLKAFHSPQTPPPTQPSTVYNPFTLPPLPVYTLPPDYTFQLPRYTQPRPQTQRVYTNKLYPPGFYLTQSPPAFNIPQGPNPPVIYNTPQPQQQLGSQGSSSSSSGMDGGTIAGVIIGVIVVAVIVVLMVVYLRRTGKIQEIKGALGFDNALYNNEPENIQL